MWAKQLERNKGGKCGSARIYAKGGDCSSAN